MAIILGIDPGSRITGYGLVLVEQSQYRFVGCGLIQVKGQSLSERLGQIYDDLSHVIESYQPTTVAIERVFVSRNVDSALKLGQARGAAIVACARYVLPVYEYSAREVKQAVVGHGGADKAQIQHMVSRILGLATVPKSDAADALAVAVCHHNNHRITQKIERALEQERI